MGGEERSEETEEDLSQLRDQMVVGREKARQPNPYLTLGKCRGFKWKKSRFLRVPKTVGGKVKRGQRTLSTLEKEVTLLGCCNFRGLPDRGGRTQEASL